VGIVLASAGYPGPFERGRPIGGLDVVADRPDVLVFHAGTALRDGTLVTDGGRVLTVVGRGPDFASAASRAYEAAACIRFDGMHYRRDIGRKALAR
jgi:phosphoribosylamine--glycine ligase